MSAPGTFAARFAKPWDDDALRARMAVKAQRLVGLSKLAPSDAAGKLGDALRAIVVPTAQMVAVVRLLIGRAKSYCDRAYPDDVAVLRLIYESGSISTAEDGQVTCLTGLGGVGKSVIFAAFCRVFSDPEHVQIPEHVDLVLHPCWRMSIRNRSSFAGMVHPHFRDQTAVRSNRILGVTVSEAAAQGIPLILPDEFQFITSSNANAMMAKLLFQFARIGPPVVFACNYSMVNALWRRPQQDRDRLLLNPIVIRPEQLGPDWTATVTECLTVADEFSALGTEANIALLHDYTCGIKRSLRTLLVLAFIQMRSESQTQVTAEHLCTAYRSPEYFSMRADVENLIQGAVTPSLLRKDLACPFRAAAPLEMGKVVEYPSSKDHASKATQAAMVSMLSPGARRLLQVLQSQGTTPPPKGKVPRRPPATAENLIGGAARFAGAQKKGGQPSTEERET